jgi:hypothetical protein
MFCESYLPSRKGVVYVLAALVLPALLAAALAPSAPPAAVVCWVCATIAPLVLHELHGSPVVVALDRRGLRVARLPLFPRHFSATTARVVSYSEAGVRIEDREQSLVLPRSLPDCDGLVLELVSNAAPTHGLEPAWRAAVAGAVAREFSSAGSDGPATPTAGKWRHHWQRWTTSLAMVACLCAAVGVVGLVRQLGAGTETATVLFRAATVAAVVSWLLGWPERARVVVTRAGLTVRTLCTQVEVPWDEVAEAGEHVIVAREGTIWLRRSDPMAPRTLAIARAVVACKQSQVQSALVSQSPHLTLPTPAA